MARDGVASIVIRLQERGFDPRKIGTDAWESRCPAHRSTDCALSITRNEHNHVVLECRSAENCQHFRIISALGFTNDHVYAETPDWLINRLGRAPIQPASFGAPPEEASAILPDGQLESGMPVEMGPRPVSDGAVGTLVAGSPLCEPTVVSAAGADGVSPSQQAPFPISSPTGAAPPIEQTPGNALELDVSRVTLVDETGDKRKRPSSITILTRLASSVPLFRSADGHFCAQVPVGNRLEIYGLRSAGFRDWLIDGYMNGQTEPPSSWAIRRVVGMLEARARFTTGMPEVFVRVGQGGGGGDTAYSTV